MVDGLESLRGFPMVSRSGKHFHLVHLKAIRMALNLAHKMDERMAPQREMNSQMGTMKC